MLATTVVILLAVFMPYLAEPGQLRYWIVPVVLAFTLGVAALEQLLRRGFDGSWPRLPVGIVLVLAALGVALPRAHVFRRGMLHQRTHPYSGSEEERLAALAAGGSVLLDTNRGVRFWPSHPAARVVAVRPWVGAGLGVPRMKRFVALYQIHATLLNAKRDSHVISLLESCDFATSATFGEDLLLVRGSGASGTQGMKVPDSAAGKERQPLAAAGGQASGSDTAPSSPDRPRSVRASVNSAVRRVRGSLREEARRHA